LVTDYAYDVLGNLQCAEQLGSGGGSFTVCSSAPTTWRPRSFTYNALSQLLTAYNPESGSLQYTYDANGNVLTKVDARGYTISYAYDNMNRLVHKNYNYNKTGVINDPSACMQYDTPLTGVNDLYPVGHMTAEWVVPSGTCPAVGTKISTIPSNAFNSTIITGHDSLGRELGNWQCPFGSNCGSTYAFNYSYDLAGNLTQFNNGMPSASSTTTSPYLNFQVTYDALSRVSQLSDLTQPWTSSDNAHPKNLLSNPVYDAMGHMTGAQVSTLPSTQTPTISISRKYDNRGRITSEIDNGQPGSGNGGITAGTISITGSENSYTNTNGTSGSTIISVSGSDGTSTFCVTNMITHVTTCRTAPNTGSLSITINGFTATASYGAGTTDAQIAVALNTGFSNSNSPVTSQYPAGSNMLILTAKATGTASNYPITIVNGGGYTITDPNNTLTGGMNGYNASDAGTITATITAPNGTTYTTSPVSWGASSTPNSIAQALASAINVATESTPGNASTNLVNATVSGSTGNINLALYHADAGLTSQFNVSVVVNDTQTSQYPTLFPYASFSANTTPINGNPQGETSATVYGYIVPPTGYAPNGNLLSYQDTVMGNWNFNYDTLNRLSTGTATSGLYNDLTGCWNYDIYGNRTQQSFQAANTSCTNTPTTTYNALNQLTSISQIAPEVDSAGTALMGTLSNSNTFTYDAAGDTTEDASNFYTYDVEGRLCMVLNLATLNYTGYFYDASGTRVAKVGLSSPTCYFGSPVYQTAYLLGPGGDQVTELAVSGGAATWKHSNLWSGTRLTATYDALGLHFHLADPLGTRRVQLSTAGAIEQSCWSLPFGDALSCVKSGLATADDATEHHFTGKERDTESGNDYFGARYLSSSAGRWLTPDWSAKVTPVPYAKMGNPQSLNLYGYIGNNPLTNFDPDGHTACGAYEGNIGACITDTASAHGDALGVYNSMLQNQTRANAVSIATGLGMIYSAFYSIFSVPVSAQLMDGRVPLINEKAPAWMHLVDGTKVSGYVYSYQAINILGGPVDCSECTLSETITKVSGNMGDDVLKNLTAPGTSWNDFIGPISDPDGKFEPGSRSNHNLQTFQITFPRGEKYTLSTVIQQNIWMLNNVLMEAYPSIIHK
jgi:RHS repeat-associated protein